jgi:hypothetical protein
VCLDGSTAYVAYGTSGLHIVGVSDPRNPTHFNTYDTPGAAYQVSVRGGIAYVADYASGLQVLDAGSGAVLGSYATPSSAVSAWLAGDYAYVAGYSSGLLILEVQCNRGRQFEGPVEAQSEAVDFAFTYVLRATLSYSAILPDDTQISFSLSSQWLVWESVSPEVEHTFSQAGHWFKWRAILSSQDIRKTPILTGVTITYDTCLSAPYCTSPDNGTTTGDSTPTFEWTSVSDAAGYLLQLDTIDTFVSSNLRNITLPGDAWNYTPTSPLADGVWYWRVVAIDSAGDLGYFATPFTMTVETEATTTTSTTTTTVQPGIPPELLLGVGAAGVIVVILAVVLLRRKGGTSGA